MFTVEPATEPQAKAKAKAKAATDYLNRVLESERGIVIASPPLEATSFQVENIR